MAGLALCGALCAMAPAHPAALAADAGPPHHATAEHPMLKALRTASPAVLRALESSAQQLNTANRSVAAADLGSRSRLRAVIVEPRDHPALSPAIELTCNVLRAPITVFHGMANRDAAVSAARMSPCVDQVVEFNAANLNGLSYSKLLLHKPFWDLIDADVALIFQTDGVPCDNSTRAAFEQQFTQYDYCGAPWPDRQVTIDQWSPLAQLSTQGEDMFGGEENNPILVGNGGLSIHHVPTARRQLELADVADLGINEDVVW